eukprot:15435969-Alexandrium_andersonii.AAC.1
MVPVNNEPVCAHDGPNTVVGDTPEHAKEAQNAHRHTSPLAGQGVQVSRSTKPTARVGGLKKV